MPKPSTGQKTRPHPSAAHHDARVVRVARAIAEQLAMDYDRLPWNSVSYQYDQSTLRRIARAAIKAAEAA